MSVRSTCQSSKAHGSVFKSRDISTLTSGHLSFVKAGSAYILLNLQGHMPWFLVSYTFGVDCISNLSDRSPDSDSEKEVPPQQRSPPPL